MIKLYILWKVIFVFNDFDTMAECNRAEERLAREVWQYEFTTLCLEVEPVEPLDAEG